MLIDWKVCPIMDLNLHMDKNYAYIDCNSEILDHGSVKVVSEKSLQLSF